MIGCWTPGGSQEYKRTVWDFYESPTPWGPWSLVESWPSAECFYAPAICPKFQSTNRIYVFTTGLYNYSASDIYRLTVVPVDLA
jgi:hypothetical protein